MFRMPSTLDLSKFTSLPIPSEIAAKTDMCENGSEMVQANGMMVQANYKIMKEKRTILLLGRDSSL